MADQSYFATSSKLLLRTLPYLGLNAAIYTALFVASVVWIAIWGGLAWLFAKIAAPLAYACMFVGAVAGGGMARWVRRYVMYVVKGGHIATLTSMLHGGDAPGGLAQLSWGKERVTKHFAEMSALFAVDVAIRRTLRAISRKVIRFVDWLPVGDTATGLARTASRIVERSLSYVDEAILSYALFRDDENVWDSARHGVLLYAQSYKPILWTAVKIWLLGKLFHVGVLVVIAVPFALLAWAFPQYIAVQLACVALAFFGAWALFAATYEPFAMTYTLVTYHYEIADKVPDPEWDQRLQDASDSFRDIVGRASPLVPRAFRPLTRPRP